MEGQVGKKMENQNGFQVWFGFGFWGQVISSGQGTQKMEAMVLLGVWGWVEGMKGLSSPTAVPLI